MFTDGISDNVFPSELEQLVGIVQQERGDLTDQELVQKIADSVLLFANLASHKVRASSEDI